MSQEIMTILIGTTPENRDVPAAIVCGGAMRCASGRRRVRQPPDSPVRWLRFARLVLLCGVLGIGAGGPCALAQPREDGANPGSKTPAALSLQSPRPLTPPPLSPEERFAGRAPDLSVALEQADEIERWLDWAGLGGSARATLYGLPAPADKAAIELACRSILSLAQSSARGIDAGIKAHDENDAQTKPEDEERINRAIHARTVRLPLRVARATLMSAAIESDAARRAQLIEKARKLAEGAEPVSPWADVERSLLRALAAIATGGENAGAEAQRYLSAAAKSVEESGDPGALGELFGLERELAGLLALAKRSGVSAALSAVTVDTPGSPTGGAGEARRRALAELRLRLVCGALPVSQAPEQALSGFQGLALAGGPAGSIDAAWARLYAILRAGPAPRGGTVQSAMLALARLDDGQTDGAPAEAVAAVSALAKGDPWVDALALALLDREPRGVESRRALAQAGLALSERTSGRAARVGVLSRVRTLLGPLGPRGDSELKRSVFEALREAGDPARVQGPGGAWGEKEVLEAMAEQAAPQDAAALLVRADALADADHPACVACWWRSLDVQLRVAPRTGDAERNIVATAEKLKTAWDAWMHNTRHHEWQADPAVREVVESALWDSMLQLDGVERTLAAHENLLGNRTWTPIGRDLLVLSATARNAEASQHLHEALGKLDDAAFAEWGSRLCDRAWAVLLPQAVEFTDARVPPAVESAAATLGVLSGVLERFPEASRAAASERCAWGLLWAGKAVDAAPLFERAIGGSGRRIDLVRGLAESKLRTGDDAGAFGLFREITTAAQPGGDHARDYFHAWARMLEILKRQNTDGTRGELISREVNRLRLLEPARFCPTCAERIEAAAR